jgi:hypothetical protein
MARWRYLPKLKHRWWKRAPSTLLHPHWLSPTRTSSELSFALRTTEWPKHTTIITYDSISRYPESQPLLPHLHRRNTHTHKEARKHRSKCSSLQGRGRGGERVNHLRRVTAVTNFAAQTSQRRVLRSTYLLNYMKPDVSSWKWSNRKKRSDVTNVELEVLERKIKTFDKLILCIF